MLIRHYQEATNESNKAEIIRDYDCETIITRMFTT